MYGPVGMARRKKLKNERTPLATMTGEPFQPVRLYWSIPTQAVVTRILAVGLLDGSARRTTR